jgi:glyoxylase-like metal-dependent hydrolase (beta-lactamase superfamily II)
MRVHHLNCGSMCPGLAPLITGRGSWRQSGLMVAHCLLVETERNGLILVDTGLGTRDVTEPRRLPPTFRLTARPMLDPSEPAIECVRRLGFAPEDVQHIAITHLDIDHAGGIADFPWATVHLHEVELAAARSGGVRERARYVRAQWQHHERWQTYAEVGDSWFGMHAVRSLAGIDDIALVPLFGHSRGHSGIAVRNNDRWLLHAGDSYFHHRELETIAPHCPPALAVFQKLTQSDGVARRDNVQELRRLRREHRNEVTVFCSHDPYELETPLENVTEPSSGETDEPSSEPEVA